MAPCPMQGCRALGPAPLPVTAAANVCLPPPDLLQVEVTKAYLAKQVDEITLQQADVVLILQQEDGKYVAGTGLGGRAWGRQEGPGRPVLSESGGPRRDPEQAGMGSCLQPPPRSCHCLCSRWARCQGPLGHPPSRIWPNVPEDPKWVLGHSES